MAKDPKPKAINFQLIPPSGKHEAYKLLTSVRHKWHEHLEEARIVLAWRMRLKSDRDGHLLLGKCIKASDLQRELVDWDFVILLNREVWESEQFTKEQKIALLDHELCHAQVSLDKYGHAKRDERGRKIWRTRKHDIEEFRSIVLRHGCYKADLEAFAEAILSKKREPALPLEMPSQFSDLTH